MLASATVAGGGVQNYKNRIELQQGLEGTASELSSGAVGQTTFNYKGSQYTIKNIPATNPDDRSFKFEHRLLSNDSSFHHSGSCSGDADVKPNKWKNLCQQYKFLGFLNQCMELVSFLNFGQQVHSFSEGLQIKSYQRANLQEVKSMFFGELHKVKPSDYRK